MTLHIKSSWKIVLPIVIAISLSSACATHHEPDGLDVVDAPKVDLVADATNQPIKIEVAANGYTPKNIGVKKGQKVILEFHRADADNCGEKLVFPDLGIERDLPVGEKVLVEITPTKTGDLKFTCGMDMFRGKLIVSE